MNVATRAAQESRAAPTSGRKGVTPPSDRAGRSSFVSDVIVELGFVDRETVENAVSEARQLGQGVPQILISQSALTEDQLARATAERYGLDHVDLAEFEVDMSATNLLSRASASRYAALPVAFDEDGALVVAMADPADPLASSDIAVMTKLDIKPVVATATGIEAFLSALPETGSHGASSAAATHTDEAGGSTSRRGKGPVMWQAEGSGGAPAPDDGALPSAEQSPVSPGQASEDQVRALGAQLEEERQAHEDTSERLRGEVDEMEAKMVALLERLDRAEGEREAGAGAAAAQAAVRAAEEATTRAEAAAKEAEAARARAEERASSVEAGLRAADDRRAQAEAVAKAAEAASESAAATAKAAEEARETAEATARSAQADREAANAAARAAQERAEAAERTGAEAVSRVTELEGADDRAERARKALAELREQAEREQELHARRERELQDALSARDARQRELSKRIAELAEVGTSVGAALDVLAAARDALGRAGDSVAHDGPDPEPAAPRSPAGP